ncbi:hypothetical protein BEP19_16210 [Ammoniphilus oxalaticus]|uniref:Solute-binding protein family 5 domain-containing protein n=1 Tax=Ammoniphilus oxalaticus TaxID=66863 RepID=A0A419SQH4_9BACL|nr:peptide ABC transporter substrate-binding protein [Ammoniphilus oxalaticus]RKD26744.1 hypothetical protein BEP19_16210 [Ammoniphilus oxalaticus]
MKAITAITNAVLSVGILLAACGALPTIKKNDETVRLNLRNEPPTLHPGLAIEHSSMILLKALMEGLTRIGPDGKPQPAAAERIDLSEDRLTYTFTLRDLTWSNGEPVTAADYETAWKWALNPTIDAPYAYQLYPIANAKKAKQGEVELTEVGIKALDTHRLEVMLENPTPYFLELTASPPYFPIHREATEKNSEWHTAASSYIGNGPFQLTEWEHGNKLVLAKNPDYWDADTVQLEQIEMMMLNEDNTEFELFQKGSLDWIGSPFSALSTDALAVFKENEQLLTAPVAGTYEYRFNTERPPFDNPNIRKALAYAIDRDQLVSRITHGEQAAATTYAPPVTFADDEGHELFLDNDVEQARQLLKQGLHEAGLQELPSIELVYNTSEAHAKIAEAMQKMWQQNLGVTTTLKSLEWETHVMEIENGNYQLARMSWLADFNDPVNFLEIYTDPQGNNNTNWTSDEYNKWITASYTEIDPRRRYQHLREAEKILMDEMPTIPIYHYAYSYAKSERLQNIYIDALGHIDFKWAYLAP